MIDVMTLKPCYNCKAKAKNGDNCHEFKHCEDTVNGFLLHVERYSRPQRKSDETVQNRQLKKENENADFSRKFEHKKVPKSPT